MTFQSPLSLQAAGWSWSKTAVTSACRPAGMTGRKEAAGGGLSPAVGEDQLPPIAQDGSSFLIHCRSLLPLCYSIAQLSAGMKLLNCAKSLNLVSRYSTATKFKASNVDVRATQVNTTLPPAFKGFVLISYPNLQLFYCSDLCEQRVPKLSIGQNICNHQSIDWGKDCRCSGWCKGGHRSRRRCSPKGFPPDCTMAANGCRRQGKADLPTG